jgi:ribosomal protein S18 acetylase RimI-like enzyme
MSDVPITIRRFEPNDAERCGAIVGATPLWQRYGLGAARASELMVGASGRGDRLVVAQGDESVAGFAWWIPRGAFGRSAYLRLIGVDPAIRSRAIGSALLSAFEEDARTLAPDCFLLVSDFNVDAQRFYARHGYFEAGRIPAYVLPDVTEILYRKVLARS